jgi:hypothetical protein
MDPDEGTGAAAWALLSAALTVFFIGLLLAGRC